MFKLLKVLRHGERLTHVETWKNGQLAINALTGLLVILVNMVPTFEASETQVTSIAGGIVAAVNVYLTMATSKKVGPKTKELT